MTTLRSTRSLTTGLLATAAFITPAAQAETELEILRRDMQTMQAELAVLKSDNAASNPLATNTPDNPPHDTHMQDDAVMTGGHNGKKFVLQSDDGNTTLNLGAQVQTRYIFNVRDGAGSSDVLNGFQLRRTKVKGSGHIASPKISYYLTLAGNRDSNAVSLEHARLGYTFDNGVRLDLGRFKAPFSFDELTSSSKQQAAERSFINEQFTLGSVEGLQATFVPADHTKVRVMLNDGIGSGESGNGDFNETPTDFALTTRVDYQLMGDKKGSFIKDYTSWSTDERSINIGGAIHFQVDDDDDTTFADDVTLFTADVLYNEAGKSAFAAIYVGDNGTDNSFGFQLQGGYNINDTWEPFARFGFVDDGNNENSLVTLGVNYFIKKHAAKFTVDGTFAFDELTNVGDSLGLEEDVPGNDGQFALRVQFQLLF
ncbi:MAG: porin [Algisphaera sp.]